MGVLLLLRHSFVIKLSRAGVEESSGVRNRECGGSRKIDGHGHLLDTWFIEVVVVLVIRQHCR